MRYMVTVVTVVTVVRYNNEVVKESEGCRSPAHGRVLGSAPGGALLDLLEA